MKLGFLASHNGSNMQAIIDACRRGDLQAEPVVVISNNSGSGAMARARAEGVPGHHLSERTHPQPDALDAAIASTLDRYEVDVVVLAGYMKKLGPRTLERFAGRILNVHPALLPKFGGKGMYGTRVHEAVLAAGDKESGVTIHLVDADYDTGAILAQSVVPVAAGDTAQTLATRVLREEHRLFAATLQRIARGELRLPAGLTARADVEAHSSRAADAEAPGHGDRR